MQPEIIYKPIRNGYARINKEGNLVLCIPSRLRNNQKFHQVLLEKGEQLLARYNKRNHVTMVGEEGVVLFGEQVAIEEITPSPKNLHKELKTILYDYAKPLLDKYSNELKIRYISLTIRRVSAKRGSCTHDQKIMLNAKLIHLPTRLIVYVIIHEACHLKIKDHSPRFRKLVEFYCPNYKILKKELSNYVLK